MRIPIDRESDIPLYRQIVNFIRESIETGALEPGTKLASSRQLAADLGINRITAASAYAELEADGLIYSIQGSGTYVAHPFNPQDGAVPVAPSSGDWPFWQQTLGEQNPTPLMHTMDEMIHSWAEARSDVIHLHYGTPDPDLFSVDEFRRVMQNVLRRDGIEAFSYGDRAGYPPLRKTIAHILGQEGIPTLPGNILITSGSQQAISLVIQVLLHSGDCVLVESPTYTGALDIFKTAGLKVIGIPVDDRGMKVETVEALILHHHPKLIYTIPTFQNPTGTCLSGHRRRALLELAGHYNIPILEDDFVGDLRYEGRSQPALKALDHGGQVIYISTFSKMLVPGLRVGYILAEGPVYSALLAYKRVTDLATSNLIQHSLESYITVGRYQAHLRRACQIYRRRRNTMLSAIHANFPPDVTFAPPHGGLFLWLRLPSGLSSLKLFQAACEDGVTFLPGPFCYPDGSGEEFLRLSFATASPEQIVTGIERLAGSLRRIRQVG